MSGTDFSEHVLRLLLIDGATSGDEPFVAALTGAGFTLEHRSTLSQAAGELHRGDFSVAVVHERNGDGEPGQLLARDHEIAARVKLIVWTDKGTLNSAKAAMNGGAFAYVESADGPEELVRQVRRAHRQSQSQRAFAAAAKLLNTENGRGDDARFYRLIENMPVLMNAIDDQSRIIVWNRECERVTGYAADEIVSNPHAFEVLYPDPEYRQQMMADWAQRGDFRDWELELTCKDGSQRTVAWSNLSLALPIAGWHSWAVGVDVTERRRAEEEVRSRGAELGRAMRLASLGELVAELAHEVKQPLYAIANYCDALRQYVSEEQNGGRAEHCLNEIVTQAQRAAAVVDQVRRRVSHLKADPAPHALASIVRDAIGWLACDVKRGGAVVSRVSARLPHVLADRVQIEQVLVNLMRNGLEAMRDAGTQGKVEITAVRQREKICVTVADQGPGVATADIERIFEPLYTSRADGMGMGLTICRRIIADHGGELWITQPAEGGAAFHFTLSIAAGS